MKYVILFISLFTFSIAFAQKDSVKYNWGVYGEKPSHPQEKITVQKELKFENIKKGKQGEIKASTPLELTTISNEIKDVKEPKDKGYRVQIMISQNKMDVLKAQSEFLKLYDDVEVYIDRKAPNYRLRVGNYYDKFEANYFKKLIEKDYPTALVVNDEIVLPTFKVEEKPEVKIDQKETE